MLALLAFAVATRASASEPGILPECGTRSDFDRELKKRLGDDAPTSSVLVSITGGASRFHLRVQIGDQLRELDDASCTELFRASVVVAIAMLMHDEPPPPKATQSPPSLTTQRQHPVFAVGAGAGVSVGTLPKPVLAFELEGKALWQYLGVSANLRYFLPTQKLGESGKGADLRALGAGVAGVFRPSQLWEARLGFAAQRLSGEGTESLAVAQSASAWAAGPTLGLTFVPLQRRWLWAALGAEGQLNAVRGRFQIIHYYHDDLDRPYVIYPVPWIAAQAFVRLGAVW